MSAKTRADKGTPPPATNLTLQRIRVNRDGYDATGAYWGAGSDVFIATTADGATDVTVRAKSAADAREKATAELTRPLGTPRSGPREPLGCTPPTKSRYEVDWRDPATEKVVRVKITHSRDYLGQGQDHVEVESIAPRKAPLPITETGYRSHFIAPLELVNAGGPVTLITAWLDREAWSKPWQSQVAKKQQGDLFTWAETQAEVGLRKSAKATTPTAKTRARSRPKPAPT